MLPLFRSLSVCLQDKYTFDSERAEPPVRPPEPRDRPEPRLVARQTVVSRLELPQPTRDAQGRFGNPWPTEPWSAFGSILHLSFKGPKTDRHELERALPLATPRWDEHVGDGLAVTWLGHSTCLVSLDGVTLLTDPHFSARASPSPLIGPKRLRPAPASVHALPHVHAVLISHAHYDHLDLASVSALNARFGRDARWFAPLGVGTWLARAGVQDVVELAWWAEAALPERQDVSFVLTPAKHASRRSLTDAGRALWGSWAVLGPRRRFFFGGDSGFCDVFALIGRLYGPFDLAALPIGAYHVSPSHVLTTCSSLSSSAARADARSARGAARGRAHAPGVGRALLGGRALGHVRAERRAPAGTAQEASGSASGAPGGRHALPDAGAGRDARAGAGRAFSLIY